MILVYTTSSASGPSIDRAWYPVDESTIAWYGEHGYPLWFQHTEVLTVEVLFGRLEPECWDCIFDGGDHYKDAVWESP